jgi:RNA polymerase sigma-70 factor (ECF subfamily)
MAGLSDAAYSEAFLTHRPAAAGLTDLEPRLRDIVGRGTRAWPQLAFDPLRMVTNLGRVIGDDVDAGLNDLFAEDFALASACMEKLPGAMAEFDRLCGPAVAAAVARVDRRPELHDEVRQVLWQRLFVGGIDQPPRIESYAGRGPLAGWVTVAAQRVALDLRRDSARTVVSDPLVDEFLPTDEHPEADYLRMRYKREFEAAVREALAALPDRDRLLLRLTTVSGLSHEQIAAIYKVNQSTVSRWISRARSEVLEVTERSVCAKLGVARDEFLSLAGLLLSRIDVSISRVLEASED